MASSDGGGQSAPRRGRRRWLLAGLVLSGAPWLRAGFFDWLIRHELQVVTVTDETAAGAVLRPPTAVEPVYYLAVNAGYRDFGGIVAGDKLPASATMVRSVVRALHQSGYRLADAQHPASQLVVFAWGTLYPETFSGDLRMPSIQLNRYAMARFLGGDKLGLVPENPHEWREPLLPGLTRLDRGADAVWTAASDELYVVALLSYEYPLKDPKQRRLLWRSKISCPARGFEMAATLPTMLVIAAPYIGHHTARPVWINASDKFKPNVQVGVPKLEEYLDSARASVIDDSASSGRRRK